MLTKGEKKMEYRERLDAKDCLWIQERIIARQEYQQDWAKYIGMSKHMFSKILHQVKPLPEKYENKWMEMEKVIKGDEPYAPICNKRKVK